MTKPKLVKRSYAIDISPTQRRVVAAAAEHAHDFIADALDDFPGVTEIHLSPQDRTQVFYDVDTTHEHPDLHSQVSHAINRAISTLAGTRLLKTA